MNCLHFLELLRALMTQGINFGITGSLSSLAKVPTPLTWLVWMDFTLLATPGIFWCDSCGFVTTDKFPCLRGWGAANWRFLGAGFGSIIVINTLCISHGYVCTSHGLNSKNSNFKRMCKDSIHFRDGGTGTLKFTYLFLYFQFLCCEAFIVQILTHLKDFVIFWSVWFKKKHLLNNYPVF